ncbi:MULTISPECIES: 16S rRNA (cytidine(1402)-2'-O)-methyltransferase [unclassified Mycoplasma]|uniref:16S rRNA (cytidine(1402)-2'-O)-methyltransferase n=1 Tax=unclassified Mycoplasma TaxID=2683645 RepID=UPI00216AED38|nr:MULTISPECIES: 16S rRNA (cytidine(1402)-2'-O)-methyltransferase [unclassified Mycoplasma]MCS4536734.1 16S rRNA (cytidine(1402)-2'-O)-methyltransferase [Mycoplasma sp. CSL7475-4]MCT4469730.1 16S rRNA (cytidine(1402)-2'-O)-methyltransferase [Mycoplasma sp. HS2188]
MSKIYIVGTPIGNLEDITLRALRILKSVDIIACEDTRVSSKLLNFYNIFDKKLITYSKINEQKSAQYIIDIVLNENKTLALVSDAGMPMVSDPGFELINLAKEKNIDIELIPGVNAAVSAFVLSSLSNTFTFHAFPKEKKGQRQQQIKELSLNTAHIFYVSPHKLVAFLDDIELIWKDKAYLFVARELTKLHESTYQGNVETVRAELNKTSQKGEFTIVVKINEEERKKVNKYSQFSKVNNIN